MHPPVTSTRALPSDPSTVLLAARPTAAAGRTLHLHPRPRVVGDGPRSTPGRGSGRGQASDRPVELVEERSAATRSVRRRAAGVHGAGAGPRRRCAPQSTSNRATTLGPKRRARHPRSSCPDGYRIVSLNCTSCQPVVRSAPGFRAEGRGLRVQASVGGGVLEKEHGIFASVSAAARSSRAKGNGSPRALTTRSLLHLVIDRRPRRRMTQPCDVLVFPMDGLGPSNRVPSLTLRASRFSPISRDRAVIVPSRAVLQRCVCCPQ